MNTEQQKDTPETQVQSVEEIVENILDICRVQHEDTDRKKCLKHYKWKNRCDCGHSSIREELLSYLTTHHQAQLREVVEKERAACIGIVKDYGERMSKLHSELLGTTHEDCKQMLVYDTHSRLIAVNHIVKALTPLSDTNKEV